MAAQQAASISHATPILGRGALVPGSVIAERYEVHELLAEGGMASVWRGLHKELGQPLAIKVLHPELLYVKGATERFLDEARVLASIRHQHVVRCWDVGTTENGIPYLVMDMLEGESLGARLDRDSKLSQFEALNVAYACLRGLSSAHEAGIVHRDIKPDNIILVDEEDGSCPKLIDFGISHVQRERATIRPRYRPTDLGALMGTPEYMSPEQARGLADIDERSDIYTLGVVLYEMLTGAPPFVSENVGDIIVSITTKDPKDLSLVDPSLDPDVCRIVMRSLQRDPSARFENAKAMRQALRPHLDRLRVSGVEPKGTGRKLQPRKRFHVTTRMGYSSAPPALEIQNEPSFIREIPLPRSETLGEDSQSGWGKRDPFRKPRTRLGFWVLSSALVLILSALGFLIFRSGEVPQHQADAADSTVRDESVSKDEPRAPTVEEALQGVGEEAEEDKPESQVPKLAAQNQELRKAKGGDAKQRSVQRPAEKRIKKTRRASRRGKRRSPVGKIIASPDF